MSSEKHECCHHESRHFTALYLLPYGYHPSADGKSVLDGADKRVGDPSSIKADMTIGVCALQPLEMIARFDDGTYGYVHAHEVRVESADSQYVEFHFDDEYEWSGVEGRQLTDSPVNVTAVWLEDETMRASADITVSPLKAMVWLPGHLRISPDGRGFVDAEGNPWAEVPVRAALAVKETLLLAAVGQYGDGLYRYMSRSELEFACVDDWVKVEYDADEDWYKVEVLAAPDSLEETAEIMLAALVSDELFASFFVQIK